MHALRIGTLGARSAALISIVLSSLYGEESAAFAVAEPEAWGLDKVCRSTCASVSVAVCVCVCSCGVGGCGCVAVGGYLCLCLCACV